MKAQRFIFNMSAARSKPNDVAKLKIIIETAKYFGKKI